MITDLLVKNIALVRETQISFREGLNIMSGETGAGKSVILGAINLALGQKAGAEMIGRYGDSAYVELTFHIEDAEQLKLLEDMDIEPQGGDIVISRKILSNKSVMKINGEASNQANVRKVTELLLDIHGQHDHQSLLYKAHHLDILDRFAGNDLKPAKLALAEHFAAYKKAREVLAEFTLDENERNRQINFLRFELDEIEKAALSEGEDEELETAYRRMVNSKRITEEVSRAYAMLGTDSSGGAGELTGHAYQAISSVAEYDEKLDGILEQISNIDSLLSDLVGELSDYISEMEYDEEQFQQVESRLNELNHLKSKYGNSIETILEYANQVQEKLDFYADYETRLAQAEDTCNRLEKQVLADCELITKIRKSHCVGLEQSITDALVDLNFGQVVFQIQMTGLNKPTANGMDEAEFVISLNPGEVVRPLSKIASGGELSRIMLGIKSVLADKDDIDTLIFDEIDSGISGRTAQMVSQKMCELARNHQILCITHLPQIAAMADSHYLIEKHVVDGGTQTTVSELAKTEIVNELSRMLGGLEITETVRSNARQMKEQADAFKHSMI